MSTSAPAFGPAERDNALALIALALAEDLGPAGDLTAQATIPADARGVARFVARGSGVVAGLPVVALLAARFELAERWQPAVRDGDRIERGTELARIEGPMRALLTLERTALNFLQRLSGVATQTARFVAEVAGTQAALFDTRKTTPGWRLLEKYAVRCGGGRNHRIGLSDAVLIKDNHLAWLAAAGDPIGHAVAAARAVAPPGTVVEVEVDTLEQLDRALECAPDIILVDNLGPAALAEAVRRRDARAPRVLLEASGGVTLASVAALARTGVDRISVGALTHSAPALDIALDLDRALPRVNIRLLHHLRGAGGAFVPLATLAADAERLRRDLDELEDFGFALERHPYHGAAYRGPAARLCPDQIEWELGTGRIGRRVAVWNRVGSTNDLAARAAGSTANDGLVILAEEQTAGRGRRGRTWSAPPASSLLMSVLVFPPAALGAAAWLTALGAVAVAEVVEAWTGAEARIKWPNDVRVGGRKVAGVLVERGPGAILGIGLNGNVAAEDFPAELRASATSLGILAGGPIDRSELARALIRRLDARYDEGLARGPEPLGGAWRARFEPLGRDVCVETTAGPIAGLLAEADLARGLTVVAADGRTRRIPGPEVLTLAIRDGAPPPR